jgi:hypothetical protein
MGWKSSSVRLQVVVARRCTGELGRLTLFILDYSCPIVMIEPQLSLRIVFWRLQLNNALGSNLVVQEEECSKPD